MMAIPSQVCAEVAADGENNILLLSTSSGINSDQENIGPGEQFVDARTDPHDSIHCNLCT